MGLRVRVREWGWRLGQGSRNESKIGGGEEQTDGWGRRAEGTGPEWRREGQQGGGAATGVDTLTCHRKGIAVFPWVEVCVSMGGWRCVCGGERAYES